MVVNSRHHYALSHINNPFLIGSKSNDDIIESIEFIDNNNFILGLQFHPEDMDNMDILYDFFLNECLIRKKY